MGECTKEGESLVQGERPLTHVSESATVGRVPPGTIPGTVMGSYYFRGYRSMVADTYRLWGRPDPGAGKDPVDLLAHCELQRPARRSLGPSGGIHVA